MSKEEMREGFETWHCEQYKTKHTTGAPTRNMHNGVRAQDYGPKKQQALWECWQETGGDVAKVEALKDEIERIEAGQQPVEALLLSDCVEYRHKGYGGGYFGTDIVMLYTHADAPEVERLRIDLELTRLARQSDQIEIDGLKALCDGFRAQLADAAQSLETISLQAGRDEFMKGMTQIRGYANSRARVAQGSLSANAEAASHDE